MYHLFRRQLGAGAAARLLLGSCGSSSGTVTTAFLAFSNLAPSSVEPLSPQRTWGGAGQSGKRSETRLESLLRGIGLRLTHDRGACVGLRLINREVLIGTSV